MTDVTLLDHLRLPLFERELVAAANRRRTYRRRCMTLGGLLGIYFLVQLVLVSAGGGGTMRALGTGYVFTDVLFIACAVMTASAVLQQSAACVAAEKEGGTLPLLLLTPLGPRRLAVQKWLSQLVDAGTLALLALPLLAVGYTYGGIGPAKVAAYVIALVQLILLAGAVGVLASCLAATVRGAGTLAVTLGASFTGALLVAAGLLWGASAGIAAALVHASMLASDLTPFGVLIMAADNRPALALTWLWWLAACVLPLVPLALMLLWSGSALARWRERSAASDAQGRLRTETGAARALPSDHGVAWLAWRQSFLGRPLFRLALPLVAGLMLLADLAPLVSASVSVDPRTIALWLFCICMVVLASSCGGMLPFERARQTLDIMLSTACSAEGMVGQLHHLHRGMLRWIVAALALALLIAALRPGGMLESIARARGGAPGSLLTCAALWAVVLASMRNCLALIIPCGLLAGAGMASPSNARANTLVHALFLLIVVPLLVFLLFMLLRVISDAFGEQAIHEHQWMTAAQTGCAVVSPMLLAWVCLLSPEGVDDFAPFPLLLALPLLHAVAVAWLDRRLCARAVARLRLPALAAATG